MPNPDFKIYQPVPIQIMIEKIIPHATCRIQDGPKWDRILRIRLRAMCHSILLEHELQGFGMVVLW